MQEPEDSNTQPSDDVAKEKKRPPGGKALLRQLQLLESAGYIQFAQEQIQVAVSEDQLEEANALIQQTRTGPPEISDQSILAPTISGGKRNSGTLSAEIGQ